MDVIAAYRDVGSYRGAAEICGTTHKTVRRIIEAQEAGGLAGAAGSGTQLRPGEGSGGAAGGEDVGPDLGEAVVAAGAGGRLCRVGAELPPAGRPGEGGVAPRPPPRPSARGVGAG